MFTPKEMLHKGIFGGTYFAELVDYKEFPEDWFKGLDESAYKSTKYLANVNLFKIKSGQSQKEWEAKDGSTLMTLEAGSSGIANIFRKKT